LELRFIGWIYDKWRGLLVSIYTAIRLQIIKFKIQVDVQKETDWKIKFEELRDKLSGEAERARRKISRGK
jgi:hypothetical protein